jgi:hypothetical protein
MALILSKMEKEWDAWGCKFSTAKREDWTYSMPICFALASEAAMAILAPARVSCSCCLEAAIVPICVLLSTKKMRNN